MAYGLRLLEELREITKVVLVRPVDYGVHVGAGHEHAQGRRDLFNPSMDLGKGEARLGRPQGEVCRPDVGTSMN
jgi:hypothetical protein